MIGFNASSVPATAAAIDGIFSLLAVVADPLRAEKFLAELKTVIAEGGRAAGQAEVERHRADLAAQERALADRKSQLDGRERDLGDVAARLSEREQELALKLAKLRALVPAAA